VKPVDPIIDADLDAYVDGELDVARRIQVESYLSEHPETAAKVMADLSMRGELRLALANESAFGRAETRDAARRLERGLAYGRIFTPFSGLPPLAFLSLPAGWRTRPSAPLPRLRWLPPCRPLPMSKMRSGPTRRRWCASRRRRLCGSLQAGGNPRRDGHRHAAASAGLDDLGRTDIPFGLRPFVSKWRSTTDRKQLSLFAVRPGVFPCSRSTISRWTMPRLPIGRSARSPTRW
jgi:anti-sigma factor RsiW